jgi:ACS family hexuronate transporter-like MFS transporter
LATFTQLLIARGTPIPFTRKTGAAIFGLLMVSAIPAIITQDPYVSIASVSIAMFGYTGCLGNTLAFPAEVFPKNALGSVWGLASMGSGLGGMIFQWLSGRMVDRFGYFPVFIAYGIMPLIAVAIMLFLIGPLRPHPHFQRLPERFKTTLPQSI